MVSSTYSPKLEQLFSRLDALTRRATVEELRAWLTESDIAVEDVAPYVRFDNERYLRHLIKEGEHYHALALCWQSAQRSPIHNHAKSTCGFKVLEGVCTETAFEHTPAGVIKAVASRDIAIDAVVASQDDEMHQVSNLQAKGQNLITLHIYSPPLLKMDVFSLTDAHVGEFRPMVLQHTDGSGI